MRLVRLLSAGKSLVGGMDHPSRYRMGEPGMLPKFGSGKNPFQAGAPDYQARAKRIARRPWVVALGLRFSSKSPCRHARPERGLGPATWLTQISGLPRLRPST